MTLIRSLLYQSFMYITIVLYASLILVTPRQVGAWLARGWARLNLRALGWICGLRYRIQGLEHLPKEATIVLAKHQSTWETIALRAILPLEQTWVLKRELMRIPFFGWALKRFQPIAIDRSAGRRAVAQLLREGLALLKAGRWVVVFPEGTRVAAGARQPYAIGGALLAERSGRPVIPVAHNAGEFWGRRSLHKRAGTIDLVIGPLMETQGRKAAEINAAVEQWIEETVEALPRPVSGKAGTLQQG
ncbi:MULTISPECIES: lysophospholipid acyltransferase family protein [Marichromatium]|uniref:1-acyl-sn-glycerol-3-phosphate acyltransferase n=1 Tax=Marichromatium gracile TaxID=1048 RepID=A0A4R4AL47_MARGR|nr:MULTISPECIES: lysophospholipid acyltransferase family protein [Marichromatium]MBK1707534.1 1-acyl-sn-glycerol-3-phosphate acyltransferase [Marichromatium gracile]RNE94142.1 1-acyl-sn-glycerol-3-phosphate acyltransferase [Marichromatium sp. AB32]TCW39884.1 1-acyl-sn-glycerol-3-phosphate acyltransferase [Marichromatium gracile]